MILKIWDIDSIIFDFNKMISERYNKCDIIELRYVTDGEHGYSGLWRAYIGKKKLFRKQKYLEYNLFDKKIKEHKHKMLMFKRQNNIDNILHEQ